MHSRVDEGDFMRRLIAAVCSIVVVTCSSAAFAQNPKPTKNDDVQKMDFELDKLISAMNIPSEAKIGAGHGPVRVMLVRPRTTFVPELYKSIENL
jgi:hypothetical protein